MFDICKHVKQSCTSYVLILTYVTLLSGRGSYSSNHHEFLAVSNNKTICEGESVAFTTIVKTDTNLEIASVTAYWHIGLKVISPNNAHLSETFTDSANKTVAVELFMPNVQRDQEGFYKCRILLRYREGGYDFVSTNYWYLRVNYFLEDSELICQRPTRFLLREGEPLRLECTGTRCNPPIRLDLRQSEPTDISIERKTSEDEVSLMGQLVVDRILHGQTVYCVATSPAFPDTSANCSFGPFIVWYTPSVTVVSDRTDLLLPIIREVNLYCVINAYPGVESFQWLYHPNLSSDHRVHDGYNLTVTLPESWNEATSLNISCEAKNDAGNARNGTMVNVTHVPNGQIQECPFMEPNTASLHDLQLMYNEQNNVLKCSVATSNTDGVRFRWYWRGRLSQERQGRHIFEHLPNGSRQFIAQDVFENVGTAIVTCEILTSRVNWKACYLKDIHHTEATTSSIDGSGRTLNHVYTEHFYSSSSSSVTTGVSDESKEDVTPIGFLDMFWMVVIIVALVLAIFSLFIILHTKLARFLRNRKLSRLNNTRSQRNSGVADTDTPRQGNEYVQPDYDSPYEEITRESHDLRPLPKPPEVHATLMHAPEQEESSGVSIIQLEIHTEDRSRKSANSLNVYASPESSPGSKDKERKCLELTDPTYMLRIENFKSSTFFAAESGSDNSLSKSADDIAGRDLPGRHESTDPTSDSAISEDEIRHIYFEKNGVF